MIRMQSAVAVVVLAAMVALGPLATSMYLPAFPAMAADFGVGADRIQLTLSAYMVGLAFAQILCGPLADRYGRKPVLLIGLGLFLVASLGCTTAETIEVLLGYRFLQAFGAAAGMVLAQAMVRDSFAPVEAARTLAYMGSTTALAPALAPVVGGALLVPFGWPAVFLLLTGWAAVVLAVVATMLPETLPTDRRQTLHPLSVLRNYRTVSLNRSFLAHALGMSLMFAGHYGFMSGAPFVLIELYGVPEQRFGWYFLLVVATFISGNLIGARIGRHFNAHRLIVLGGTLLILAGLLMVGLVAGGLGGTAALIGPQMIYAMGAGFMMPQLITGALMPFRNMAGTAAALMGFLQMGAAAIASALVGRLHDGTARPMVYIIAASALSTLLVYLLLRPRSAEA